MVETVTGIKYNIPKELLRVHGYDKEYIKLIEFKTKLNILSMPINESYKGKLYKSQNGHCYGCGKPIITNENAGLYSNSVHIHHLKPISEGGSNTKLSNMKLIHI